MNNPYVIESDYLGKKIILQDVEVDINNLNFESLVHEAVKNGQFTFHRVLRYIHKDFYLNDRKQFEPHTKIVLSEQLSDKMAKIVTVLTELGYKNGTFLEH